MLRLPDTSREALAELRGARIAIPLADRVLRVEGPGAIACLQGVLTNDVEKAGQPSLIWGAVLTPKGMIITDLWLARDADGAWLIVPEAGYPALVELLRRTFPPRLATVTDHSESRQVWQLIGPHDDRDLALDRLLPTELAPFDAMLIADREKGTSVLLESGYRIADSTVATLLGFIAGWPSVGHEIDERTLPQEVRFDDLLGVKYDKGCYTGQETVARLHFRGHANRTLRAVTGVGRPPADPALSVAEKEVGRIARIISIGASWWGSARIRREVATGDSVTVEGVPAVVHDFPIEP